jgi:hypothetical protein
VKWCGEEKGFGVLRVNSVADFYSVATSQLPKREGITYREAIIEERLYLFPS